jgi:hypothetical protein
VRSFDVRDVVTTLLDALGLLLVAAGVAGGLWFFVGAWALVAAGVVVLVGSQVAAHFASVPVRGDSV